MLRELATLPRRVVDALEINRELGSEAWVRELCTAANLGSAKSRDDCFHAAARSGAADLVEECIRLGVDVNSSNTWPDHVDMAVLKANQSDLHVALKQQSTITVEELSSGYAVVATVSLIERP